MFNPPTPLVRLFGIRLFFAIVISITTASIEKEERGIEGKGKGVLKGERETGGKGVRYPTGFVSDPRKRCLRCATPP